MIDLLKQQSLDLAFLRQINEKKETVKQINQKLQVMTGVPNFFKNFLEINDFSQQVSELSTLNKSIKDFGDFQTPLSLSDQVCAKLVNMGYDPTILIEPTCGIGNFVLSALQHFKNIKKIIAFDIQKKYEWYFKFNLMINSSHLKYKSQIIFKQQDIFDTNFTQILSEFSDLSAHSKLDEILILGNPPWITNTALSKIDSGNLPIKSNIKKEKGLTALTGGGNFDIAENIIISLIRALQNYNTNLAMLCKSIVSHNIIRDSFKYNVQIGNCHSYKIDSKKEFDVHVDANLLTLNIRNQNKIPASNPSLTCKVDSLYHSNYNKIEPYIFGYVNGKFVSNVETYKESAQFDGQSQKEWRQGVKHDASKVFELEFDINRKIYLNGFGEIVNIEPQRIFPLVKSSHIAQFFIEHPKKYVILTQNKIGQETDSIQQKTPKLWMYLNIYKDKLNARKSKIYTNSPQFAIFGVGDFTFHH